MLLAVDPESEVYFYTSKSKDNTIRGVAWYNVGGLCFLIGTGFMTNFGEPVPSSGSAVGDAAGNIGTRFVSVAVLLWAPSPSSRVSTAPAVPLQPGLGPGSLPTPAVTRHSQLRIISAVS